MDSEQILARLDNLEQRVWRGNGAALTSKVALHEQSIDSLEDTVNDVVKGHQTITEKLTDHLTREDERAKIAQRFQTAITILLTVIIAISGWLLYRVENKLAAHAQNADPAVADPTYSDVPVTIHTRHERTTPPQ